MIEKIFKKLCSRKLWLAVSSFVVGLLILGGVDNEQADKIGGAIISGASVLAYCIGEGLADSKTESKKGDDDNV